jgi:hypothetical protein
MTQEPDGFASLPVDKAEPTFWSCHLAPSVASAVDDYCDEKLQSLHIFKATDAMVPAVGIKRLVWRCI